MRYQVFSICDLKSKPNNDFSILIFRIHYRTFMKLRWTFNRGRLVLTVPIIKPKLGIVHVLCQWTHAGGKIWIISDFSHFVFTAQLLYIVYTATVDHILCLLKSSSCWVFLLIFSVGLFLSWRGAFIIVKLTIYMYPLSREMLTW